MLFTPYIQNIPFKNHLDQEKFSFVEGFSDEKQEKTMTNSVTKNSDLQATSCCTCGLGTEYQKEEDEQFFSDHDQTSSQPGQCQTLSKGAIISRQIIYSSAEQYQKILENLLNKNHLNAQNIVYLRLLIVDKQAAIDHRLEPYLEWALEQYRRLRQKHYTPTFNSALPTPRNLP